VSTERRSRRPFGERKRSFGRLLYLKRITLPRQARDKHRESTQKIVLFSHSDGLATLNDFDNPEFEGREKYPQSGVHGNDVFSAPFHAKSRTLAKTGSGQTSETFEKEKKNDDVSAGDGSMGAPSGLDFVLAHLKGTVHDSKL
jgi:hypothetical protein